MRFGSGEALAKLVQHTYETATQEPAVLIQRLAGLRTDRAEAARAVESLTAFDAGRLAELEKSLSALEADMKNNPFIRGAARAKAKAAQAAAGAGDPRPSAAPAPAPGAATGISRRPARI